MWTRAELKERAKVGLKQYYWYGVLAIVAQGVLIWIITLLSVFIPLVGLISNVLVSIFATNVISVGLCSYFRCCLSGFGHCFLSFPESLNAMSTIW